MASIKKNILLNGINTVTGIVFPIITFPYAARVLLPEGIGAVNFLNSIISYIVLLTSLGIPMYAVKEVAKFRDNKQQRDCITIEIFILSFLLCLAGYIAVWFLAKFVPQIHRQQALFFVLSLTILFTSIGVNWFYQAIEDFKFITIRAIVIRSLAAASLFVFVKTPSDLIIYGLIVVGSTVGNNLINFIHLRRHINIKLINIGNLNVTRHIKPAITVFILNLIISLYVHLNSIMLGFMAGDDSVGFFTAGTKISHVGITIISSIGTVMLPRCSNLINSGEFDKFKKIINKSLELILLLSFPLMGGLFILATPITLVFCGEDYYPAIPVLLYNIPTIYFISITTMTGIQILFPMEKINIVIYSVIIGAAINLVLNFILIPSYGAIGASISTTIVELIVFLIQIFIGKKYLPFSIHHLFNLRYLTGTVIMCISIYITSAYFHNIYLKTSFGITTGFLVYIIYLYFTKDPFLESIIFSIKNKITK